MQDEIHALISPKCALDEAVAVAGSLPVELYPTLGAIKS